MQFASVPTHVPLAFQITCFTQVEANIKGLNPDYVILKISSPDIYMPLNISFSSLSPCYPIK